MGNPIAIIGTLSSHGGSMITASGTRFQMAGSQGGVCLQGDLHSCPIPGHGVTQIVSGCATRATVNGIPIAIQGSVSGCGAVLTSNFATRTSIG